MELNAEGSAAVAVMQQLLSKRLLLSTKQPLAGGSPNLTTPVQPFSSSAMPLSRQLLGPRALPPGSRHWLHQVTAAAHQPQGSSVRWFLPGGRAALGALGAARPAAPQPRALRTATNSMASQTAKDKFAVATAAKKIFGADRI